jgi:hypothetical protein
MKKIVYHPTYGVPSIAIINPYNTNEFIFYSGMNYEWGKMKENKDADYVARPYQNEIGVLMLQTGFAVDMI